MIDDTYDEMYKALDALARRSNKPIRREHDWIAVLLYGDWAVAFQDEYMDSHTMCRICGEEIGTNGRYEEIYDHGTMHLREHGLLAFL